MSKSILVRNIDHEMESWIEDECRARRMPRQEFMLQVLRESMKSSKEPILSFPFAGQENQYPIGFKFIDLFAGIGGFRIALESVGGKCVFSSEIDPYAQRTYFQWFGEEPYGDINDLEPDGLQDYDILAAGFPCQPFSIAGVSKHNALGNAHGFEHATQGNLFFILRDIIRESRPRAFILENVKNLRSHDRGTTFKVIMHSLREELGYFLPEPRVIDARFLVPQHRERIYIVGFRDKVDADRFAFPEIADRSPKLRDILDDEVDPKYTLSDKLWAYLQAYAEKHRAKGNGFGFGLADLDGITRTLSARYYKDGAEILIPQGRKKNPRRLTPRECGRLMGFPDDKVNPCSDTRAYKQYGNSVVVPVVTEIAKSLVATLSVGMSQRNERALSQGQSASSRGLTTGPR